MLFFLLLVAPLPPYGAPGTKQGIKGRIKQKPGEQLWLIQQSEMGINKLNPSGEINLLRTWKQHATGSTEKDSNKCNSKRRARMISDM